MTYDKKNSARVGVDEGSRDAWEITWFTCRADANDVKHEATRKLKRGEQRRDLKVGDALWRVAKSIGPISPDHCHWAGWHLGVDEDEARLIAAVPELVEALRKALTLRDEFWEPEARALLARIEGDPARHRIAATAPLLDLIEGAMADLSECPKWLQCVPSHEAGSTTDLLIDRINTTLATLAKLRDGIARGEG